MHPREGSTLAAGSGLHSSHSQRRDHILRLPMEAPVATYPQAWRGLATAWRQHTRKSGAA